MKRKYLVFGISSQLGGVESFLMNYISKMMDEENVFEFVIFDKVPDFIKISDVNKCKMHIVPKRTNNLLLYYKKLIKILREGKFDIIWYNVCTLSDITLLKLAQKQDVPCRIVHSHNGANMGGIINEFLHNYHKKVVEKYATEFFACSNVAAEFMFPSNIIETEKTIIIKNAIDTSKYQYNAKTRSKVRESLGIKSQLLIGHVGRFHFQKNHRFILDIFNEILRRKKNVKLLLIGKGELKEQFIEQAEEKGVLQNIIMLEDRTDVNELMQAMDVFLFPSLFEGLPISLIEAQTADLPCVISDTISEEVIITEKICALSLNDSSEMWAAKVLRCAENQKRENRSDLVRRKKFDISENAEELKRYLELKY
ncbi:glycosyltransferase [Bariatricus sp. SGI.019]|uniref:glycosyltransferase n=1 Tax=Bariatricus sp. SGI.019 TaxID=3420548 RepID=UPI003D0090BA